MPTEQVPDQQQREAEIREWYGRLTRARIDHDDMAQDIGCLLSALDRERAANLELRKVIDDADGVLRGPYADNEEAWAVACTYLERLRALLHPESTGQDDK